MAGKRGATSDLNHDNWDREDESEDAGTFRKASDDVLKRRVIKTARRRNIGALAEEEGAEKKKNIFGGFTAFAKTPANPSSAFSFLNKTDEVQDANIVKNDVSNVNGSAKKDAGKSAETGDEYLGKLKGLNESVAKWIKTHVDKNPFVSLKPIFADYEKYLDEIERTRDVKVSAETKKELSTFMFKSPSKQTVEPKKIEVTSSFSFGSAAPKFPISFSSKTENKESKETKKTDVKEDKVTFSFGTPQEKKELPKFGFDPAKPAPAFTFGTPATTAAKPFSFTSSTPFTFGDVSAPKPAEPVEENDEDEPPKVTFTPVVEEGHVYTVRCKVFVKKDGNFGDRGVGNLYLKPVPDSEKVQLIVRADTNLGNLLCNFILSEAIPTQRMGKKDVMLVCLPTPDCKPPPVPILLRVKSPEEADELLKILDKHKK